MRFALGCLLLFGVACQGETVADVVATRVTGHLELPPGEGNRGVEVIVTVDGQELWMRPEATIDFAKRFDGRLERVRVVSGIQRELLTIESDALPAPDADGTIDLGTIDLRDRLLGHRFRIEAAEGAAGGPVRIALCHGLPPRDMLGQRISLGSWQFPSIELGSDVDWLLPRGATDLYFLVERPVDPNDERWLTGTQRLFGPYDLGSLPATLEMD